MDVPPSPFPADGDQQAQVAHLSGGSARLIAPAFWQLQGETQYKRFRNRSMTMLGSRSMNVLLTGGAGFIGSHLAERLLARGDRLTVLDDFNDFYDPAVKHRNMAGFRGRVDLVTGDIGDAGLVARVFGATRFDAVIHLAARAGVRPSLRDPLLYTMVNVVGTQILLEQARLRGVGKFVFASSSSVYGVNAKVPFAESDPLTGPISPYAATKLAGEAMGHVYHHLYGLDLVCLRFFTVYGPRQRPDLAIHKFARAILAGQPVELYGDGSSRRDYTYIEDILDGIVAALDRRLGFEIINLGGSQTTSLRELVELLARATGGQPQIVWQPDQPGDVPVTYADVGKAERLLGYRPRVGIAEGIDRFVAWLRRADP